MNFDVGDPPKPKKPPAPPPSFGDPGIYSAGKWLRLQSRKGGIASTIGFGRKVSQGLGGAVRTVRPGVGTS